MMRFSPSVGSQSPERSAPVLGRSNATIPGALEKTMPFVIRTLLRPGTGALRNIGVALAGLLPCCATSLADPATLKVARVAEPFALADVRLLDGPFREAMLRDQKYLLEIGRAHV